MNPTKKRTAFIYTALNQQNQVQFVTERREKDPSLPSYPAMV